MEVPHSRGVNPRPPWTRLSNSRKTKDGRTTMMIDPCSQVWITMSVTKRWLFRDYPIESRDAIPRRKRPLCVPFNDVSSFSFSHGLALFSIALHLSVMWLSPFLRCNITTSPSFLPCSDGRARSYRRFHQTLCTAAHCRQTSRFKVYYSTNVGGSDKR